ncbi:ATP-binding cassette domain-containing protein [Paramaledivibacter caminithermalis]|jgi:putative ABC transport system ATP-binding protein|uniref:Putative ABC transport system ATP-binding protein n=1 Tax=Paramaledivibacter caminithermalis (strain DSM 15212 / CIP 107654 / DViRD3) TaxID=1121301 RepID=A0A1M6TFP4_PARC5|nr:ATP-binding cassette domain-containing protein [Paramaledivibacter caminithermalis]SHK55791.1 putative ABC transport system ATP-binding protein [Paramaledivibacter caminithermalis DSM 15212]
MEILKLYNVSKSYGNNQVLKNISFNVNHKELLGIMGASSSGKTTLLNCISTIDLPTCGEIVFENSNLVELSGKEMAMFRRKNLGFIFQDYNLLDILTIKENIALALTINRTPINIIDTKVQEVASNFRIEDILNKYPYQVSGGQKQRCACARAIITNPKLIFADEPTGALDSNSSKNLMETMEHMVNDLFATILMVTHDIFVASYATRILFLKDGRIHYELIRGNKSHKEFYNEISEVISSIGGA